MPRFPEHPHWGSWGGRYSYYDETMTARHYADAIDSAVGIDGKKYASIGQAYGNGAVPSRMTLPRVCGGR